MDGWMADAEQVEQWARWWMQKEMANNEDGLSGKKNIIKIDYANYVDGPAVAPLSLLIDI